MQSHTHGTRYGESQAPKMMSVPQKRPVDTWETILLLDIPDSWFPSNPEACFGPVGSDKVPRKPRRESPVWSSGPLM